MHDTSKKWYEKLIDPSQLSNDYYQTDASTLRSVQSLLAEPNATIHQVLTMRQSSLPLNVQICTSNQDLAIYFSVTCFGEKYVQMPVGLVLRIDGNFIGRALTWSMNSTKSFISNMIIESSIEPGNHILTIEPLNDHFSFDQSSIFNLTLIEI